MRIYTYNRLHSRDFPALMQLVQPARL